MSYSYQSIDSGGSSNSGDDHDSDVERFRGRDRQQRRSSVLDYGGANSINQLIKSISRNIDATTAEEISDYQEQDQDQETETEPLVPMAKSTLFQTVFNSINILIGIGLLSLPLAFKYCGLILGTLSLLLCGVITQFTASLLASCYNKNHHYKSYNNLGLKLIGAKFNFIIIILFNIDLIGAILALIILFADSFHTILGIDKLILKLVIVTVLFGLNFVPLNILSILSICGIICTNTMIIVTLVCGFWKREAPGSLIDPIFDLTITLYPKSFQKLLMGISMMMSNFGGHAVLPDFIDDMRHPLKAKKSFKISFGFTILVDMIIGISAFLMFGDDIEDEFTQNLMKTTEGYPVWCNFLINLSIGLLPISKLPLITRPIMVYLETITHVSSAHSGKRVAIKLFLSLFFLTLSIFITKFGQMMAFLGAFICFTICITLPLSFYYKIFKQDLSKWDKTGLLIGIVLSVVFAIAGTIASLI